MKTGNILVFDYTMRFLYITLRNHRVPIVAIEFVHRGKRWKADTPEEAIQLRNQLEIADRIESEISPFPDEILRSETVWTPDVFWDFVHSVGPQQRIVLETFVDGISINSADLAIKLKLESELALGGVISGLSKQLKRFNLKPTDLYVVSTDWSGGNRTRTFVIHKSFRMAAEEAGWPEERKPNATPTKTKRKIARAARSVNS